MGVCSLMKYLIYQDLPASAVLPEQVREMRREAPTSSYSTSTCLGPSSRRFSRRMLVVRVDSAHDLKPQELAHR